VPLASLNLEQIIAGGVPLAGDELSVLDHRLCATGSETLQRPVDEPAHTFPRDLLAVVDVVLEPGVAKLRHRLVDEIVLPASKQFAQLHSCLRKTDCRFEVGSYGSKKTHHSTTNGPVSNFSKVNSVLLVSSEPLV
jgi:hypothetical protein